MTLMRPWGSGGGSVGRPEDSKILTLPTTSEEFYAALITTARIGPFLDELEDEG
jgi:hypothetical protein